MPSAPYFEYHSFPNGDAPFTGNPAGVCFLDAFPDDATLLGIAASNNHPETSFLVKDDAEAASWRLRWFTPAVEVDLCGHATLAAAEALYDRGDAGGDGILFETRSGPLRVERRGDDLEMSFPALRFETIDVERDVLAAIGHGGGAAEMFEVEQVHGARFCIVALETEADVRALQPDFAALTRARVNIVATAPGEASDIASRFFAPACGVDEDPVTGSAHCALAPFWAGRLGRQRIAARQVGPRPGALQLEMRGDRVALIGRARKYLEGRLVF
ncbi:MAG: PhzF family phenazine biosynthesis isomerase [Pseudomonadota bacterium]